MRLTILGFSQELAIEYGLDINDLILLKYILEANSTPSMLHYHPEDDSSSYVWLSRSKILEDLPILDISESRLSHILIELKKKNLLESINKPNLNGSKTYYRLTDKAVDMKYCTNTRCAKNSNPDNAKNSTPDNKLNTNIFSKLNISDNNKTISKDIVEETSNNTNSISQNSKDTKYNPILEIMDNNKYVSKTKKKNKYEQGMDIIDNYTNNDILKEKLVIYLKFRLENKEKPMYINQWKGIVAKLDTLASDLDTQVKIVQQSIDRGYLGFYPLTTYNKQPQKKFIDDQVTVKIENEDISNERF